jgi:hypothetical protein
MPDPIDELKDHHPQGIDLSGVPRRAFTDEERVALVQAARAAATQRDWATWAVGFLVKIGAKLV